MWSLLAVLLLVQRGWTQRCNQFFGPSGTTACVKISSYNDQYQWATCLTSSYILQKSSRRHICRNPFTVYCWYQCMIEVHNKESGPVTSDCSCTPSFVPKPPLSPTTSLPSFCYSPSGTSCLWYRSCLEKKYPCKDTNNADPIRYAEEMCWLYNNRKSIFSSDGRKWVDGVRKCLQVNLVPFLRPWAKPTCHDIGQKAFETQVSCYLNPDQGVPSICDLDCKEYLKFFWVIKGYIFRVEKVWESLSGLWNIDDKCGSNSSRNCFEEGDQRLIKITKISFKKFNPRVKRSLDPISDETARRRFADRVASAIARGLKWDTMVMDWFAFPSNATNASDPTSLEMVMVLADKKALGITTTFRPSFNFNQSLQQLSSAIKESTLPLQVDGYNVWVKSLSSCTDKTCNVTLTLADSDRPPIWHFPTTPGNPVTLQSEIPSTETTDSIFVPDERPTGKIPVKQKPAKRNDGASIAHRNARIYAVTEFVIMLIYKLSF